MELPQALDKEIPNSGIQNKEDPTKEPPNEDNPSQVPVKDALPVNPPKKSNMGLKVLIFTLSGLIVIVLGVVVAMALLNSSGLISISPTPTVINTPSVTPTVETSPIPSNKIVINYLETPQQLARLSLIKKINDADEPTNSEYYKLGTVRQGVVDKSGTSMDFKDFDYIMIIIDKNRAIEGPVCQYMLMLKSPIDGKYYKMKDACQADDSVFFMTLEFVSQVNTDYSNIIYPDNDPLAEYSFQQNSRLTTDGGNVFVRESMPMPLFFNSSKSRKIDSLGNVDIYLNTDELDQTFYVTKDHLLFMLEYVPKIVDIGADGYFVSKINITWNDNSKNEDTYQWVSLGSCFNNYLEVSNIDPNTVKITGMGKNSSPVYEPKDLSDAYLTKIYPEYIEMPDHQDLTKAQFALKHPFFYWQDPYGRYIKFGNDNYIFTGGCAKPAIYLYPTKTMSVSVHLEVKGQLTYTYPKYNQGWSVLASPSGKLLNFADNNEYPYLWWESRAGSIQLPDRGFVVKKSDLNDFLVSKLNALKLNDQETSDFISYWVPIINKEKSEYIYISFLFNKQVEQLARIDYSTSPDSEIRVFMVYKPVSENYKAEELILPQNKREGFTVVEWGGAELP